MNYYFTIHERLPSLNDYLNKCKFNRHIAANFKRRVDRDICSEIKFQLENIHITKPVIIHIKWVEENKKRDVDNVYSAVKFIQDELVKMGTISNDNVKNVIDVKNEIVYSDNKKSYVIVWIEEVEN